MTAKPKPNRVLLVVVSIVACLILLVSFGSLSSRAAVPPPTQIPQVAPLNPNFLDFIQNRPAEFYGYIPPPVDLRHLKDIPVRKPGLEAQPTLEAPLALPAIFDWRDTGKVTPVKDQNPCGTCWLFGTLAAVESKVLIGENTAFDFSEQNVACCTDPSWVYLNNNRCMGGGWSWLAADTLSKKGTRLESCDPYNTATINSEACSDTCTTTKRVTGYRLLAPRLDEVTDIDLVKDAVYSQGPVSMAFYWVSGPAHFNSDTNIYHYLNCPWPPNHLVCIVGWDDTIDHPTGPGSGAWIVKNSWGTGWGASGYFYLTYGSGNMEEVAYYEYRDYSTSEKIYYWDEAGWVNDAGYGTIDYAWMANVFTVEQSGTLTNVDFWATSNNAGYEIKVYQDDDPANGLSSPLHSQTGSCQEAGYYSIALDLPVSVSAGQPYTIAVKMTTTGYNYPIPIEQVVVDWCEPPIQTGVSYMSPDGTSWTDIGAGYDWNASLRAKVLEATVSVTVTPSAIAYGTVALEMSQDTVTLGQQLTVTNNGGVTANFSIKSSDATRDGGTTWTLVTATPGHNQFKHEFSTEGSFPGTALMTSYQSLATGKAPGATQAFDLQITMPGSTTDYPEHTIIITILAVAAEG